MRVQKSPRPRCEWRYWTGIGGAVGSGEPGVRRKVRQNFGTGGAEAEWRFEPRASGLNLRKNLARPERLELPTTWFEGREARQAHLFINDLRHLPVC